MKGSRRAKPSTALFQKISSQLALPTTPKIDKQNWKFILGAAALIIIVNISAIVYYTQYIETPQNEIILDGMYASSLINPYQIYDQ